MPVQTSPPSLLDSFPSFMSVYGGLPPRYKEEDSSIQPLQVPSHIPVDTRRLHPSAHRESVSSTTTASTESSPTTTVSPFDSPAGGDISPSSSPESPTAMPMSYPKFTPFAARHVEPASHPSLSTDVPRLSPNPSTNALSSPSSPGRRARNLKNLSLRMPPPSQGRPPIATASVVETTSSHHLSGPPSPIQIPPKSSRRRPANLTIRTPGFDKSFSNHAVDVVPPTPLGPQQSLRHTESTPSLASITSPCFAPTGGMNLPRPMTHHGAHLSPGASSEDTTSPLTSLPDNGSTFSHCVLHELEEEDDHIDSRESTRKKDRGYPDGPIRIHDSGVYLYLEPTAEEAAKFDVVVNVAKEVANPFITTKEERNDTVMSTWRNASMASNRFSSGDPHTAMSEVSFKSAFEFQPPDCDSGTPTTPTPTSANPTPEYIHVSWDHNSEILDDLLPLCELIDGRISQGKRVLVHCQLGASRSASLVIAYGLYKNQHLDFNSMYEMVKERSQWVGPNMSLIYQLTDFRSRLMRAPPSRPPPQEWFVNGNRRSSEPQHPQAQQATANMAAADSTASRRPPFRKLAQAPSLGCLNVSSTSSMRPTTSDGRGMPKSPSPKRSLSPRPLPFRQKFQSIAPASGSGRRRGLARISSCEPLIQSHVFMRDAPNPEPALFSPRTTDFLAPPSFVPPLLRPPPSRGNSHIPDAPQPMQLTPEPVDPRSPPSGGEPLIMRNIDEFL
ncbi:uncharacterized protein PFLUO_LOCUS6933 [Penicillium psychrofluorescens]|uniref:uncharacterized protein n=1 Tax=Penicillium psychrofluorescens TaxID=3158075 RepID=UPI003CCE503B